MRTPSQTQVPGTQPRQAPPKGQRILPSPRSPAIKRPLGMELPRAVRKPRRDAECSVIQQGSAHRTLRRRLRALRCHQLDTRSPDSGRGGRGALTRELPTTLYAMQRPEGRHDRSDRYRCVPGHPDPPRRLEAMLQLSANEDVPRVLHSRTRPRDTRRMPPVHAGIQSRVVPTQAIRMTQTGTRPVLRQRLRRAGFSFQFRTKVRYRPFRGHCGPSLRRIWSRVRKGRWGGRY